MKIDRRGLLAGLTGSGCCVGGQEPDRSAGIGPSIYIPKAQLVEDRRLIHDFMEEHPFVELVTSSPTLRITHIPVLLDRAAGEFGCVFGHISRQNPQRQAIDGRQVAVTVFRGPHGYISPTWFARREAVPTWNFAVVHASGRPREIKDRDALRRVLDRLVASFESGTGYGLSDLPQSYVSSLMEGVVGFEMPLELLEGKFKLGQSWSEAERDAALEHLRQQASREVSLHEFSKRYFQRAERR